MAQQHTTHSALAFLATRSTVPAAARVALHVSVLLVKWQETWKGRRVLGRADPHILRDIGLTQDAADAEARRPFWDAPDTWRL